MRRFYSHEQAVEERRRQQIIAAIGNAFIASGLQNADRSEYPDKVARAVREAGGAPETAAWARELAEEIGRTEYSADGLAEARSAAARAAEQVAAQVAEETADTDDRAEPDAETVFRAVYDGMRPGGVRERARERARRAAAGAQEWDDLSEERRRLVEQVTERSLTARRRQRQERRAEVDPAEEADAVRRAVLESVRGPR